MEAVLRKELRTKDENGFYDPFFRAGDSDPEARAWLPAQSGVASAFGEKARVGGIFAKVTSVACR